MKNEATSLHIFREVFGSTMSKDGFQLKNKSSYYAVDCENLWIKKLSINLWDNGRLFRICVDINLFTDEHCLSFAENMDSSHDIDKMHPSPSPLWKGRVRKEEAFFTLEPYMPTFENMSKAHHHYLDWIREPFVNCRQFTDAIKCNAIIQAMAIPLRADELNRMNAYLYVGDITNATLAAYRYRNELMRNIECFMDDINKDKVRDSLETYYQTSLMSLRKKLDDIVTVIYMLSKNDTSQLIQIIENRVAKRREEVIRLFSIS